MTKINSLPISLSISRINAFISALLTASLQFGCAAPYPPQNKQGDALEKLHALFQAPEVLLDPAAVSNILDANLFKRDCAVKTERGDQPCPFQDYDFVTLSSPLQVHDPEGKDIRGKGQYYISLNRDRAALRLYVDTSAECVTQHQVEEKFHERLLPITPFPSPNIDNSTRPQSEAKGRDTPLPEGGIPPRDVPYTYRHANADLALHFSSGDRRCAYELSVVYDVAIKSRPKLLFAPN